MEEGGEQNKEQLGFVDPFSLSGITGNQHAHHVHDVVRSKSVLTWGSPFWYRSFTVALV